MPGRRNLFGRDRDGDDEPRLIRPGDTFTIDEDRAGLIRHAILLASSVAVAWCAPDPDTVLAYSPKSPTLPCRAAGPQVSLSLSFPALSICPIAVLDLAPVLG